MERSQSPRLPPGQRLTTDFPVLDLGRVPDIAHSDWRLELFGDVGRKTTLDWQQLLALPQVLHKADFHCVTTWSRFDLAWEGVLAREVVALAAPAPEVRFVVAHGSDGYTTNLPLSVLCDDDVLIAHGLDQGPLAPEHGGPVRLVVPKRYGWKSAKWLWALEFLREDRPGYWEVRGYHNDADPWEEERYG